MKGATCAYDIYPYNGGRACAGNLTRVPGPREPPRLGPAQGHRAADAARHGARDGPDRRRRSKSLTPADLRSEVDDVDLGATSINYFVHASPSRASIRATAQEPDDARRRHEGQPGDHAARACPQRGQLLRPPPQPSTTTASRSSRRVLADRHVLVNLATTVVTPTFTVTSAGMRRRPCTTSRLQHPAGQGQVRRHHGKTIAPVPAVVSATGTPDYVCVYYCSDQRRVGVRQVGHARRLSSAREHSSQAFRVRHRAGVLRRHERGRRRARDFERRAVGALDRRVGAVLEQQAQRLHVAAVRRLRQRASGSRSSMFGSPRDAGGDHAGVRNGVERRRAVGVNGVHVAQSVLGEEEGARLFVLLAGQDERRHPVVDAEAASSAVRGPRAPHGGDGFGLGTAHLALTLAR